MVSLHIKLRGTFHSRKPILAHFQIFTPKLIRQLMANVQRSAWNDFFILYNCLFSFLLSADSSISVTPENMIIKVHQAALTVIDIIEILPIVLFPENYYENRYFGTEL